MRKIFIAIFGVFYFSILFSQTSIYHSFPDSNAVWRENRETDLVCPPITNEYDCQKFLGGDTVIGIFTYKKIYESGMHYYISNTSNTTTPYTNTYVGALRQNAAHKKVFIVPQGDSVEWVLYDFNLNVGDTLPASYINNQLNYFDTNYVTTIDSVFASNNYRKRYWISDRYNQNYANIIEGIGCSLGFCSFIKPNDSPYSSANLLCFMQNENPIYPDTTGCTLVATGLNEPNGNFSVKLFPNPSSGIFNFYSDFSSYENNNLKIFNTLGECIYQSPILNAKSIVDLSPQPKGVYFYQFISEGKNIASGKLIVQ